MPVKTSTLPGSSVVPQQKRRQRSRGHASASGAQSRPWVLEARWRGRRGFLRAPEGLLEEVMGKLGLW